MFHIVLGLILVCVISLAVVLYGFLTEPKKALHPGLNRIPTGDHVSVQPGGTRPVTSIAEAISAGGIRPLMTVPRKHPAIRTRHSRSLP